jgi:hypothetical protein
MSSKTKEREERRLKYTSGRERAKKKEQMGSFSATFLKLPQGVTMFRPKAGIYLLDVLPFRAGKGNPFAQPGALHYERTFHLHGRVGADQNAYLCPRMTAKKPCPICEHRQHLTHKDAAENEDLIKDLAPRERQMFNIRNLKDPDKGIQLFEISYHLFGRLLDARIRDSDEEDEWDLFYRLEGGLTLKVGFVDKSFGGRNFVEAETIDFKPRKEDYDEEVLEQVYGLDDLLRLRDYDELKEIFLESKDEGDDEEEDKPKSRIKTKVRDNGEDADEEEEEEPKAKKKRVVEEDDSEDEPEVEDSDEEDEPKPKKKKKAADDEEDEDEEEADDSDDSDDSDEDEEPKPKAKKKAKDEEEDWDDFDEEETPKAKKKKTDPEDSDEEEADDSDEEEEPKAKKKNRFAPDDDEDEDGDRPRVKAGKKKDDDDEEEE